MTHNRIWFNQPANRWEEAQPIGNGTLGGMVFGKTDVERIQLNEDSLWYGGPIDRNNPDALGNLDEIRKLVFSGQIREAEELAAGVLVGMPDGQRHYEPLGDLYLDCGFHGDNAENYRRELDLDKGIIRVQYSVNQAKYRREYFCSFPDQVMVIQLGSSIPGSCFRRCHKPGRVVV